MPQLRSSDLNIARAQSSDITIVTATIDMPWVPTESCAGKQTGAVQRLPPVSLALSTSC